MQDLLRAGNLQIRSALLFARLDEKRQAEALKTIHSRQGHLIADGAVLSHREVDHLVLLNTHKLAHAKWALGDEDLTPSAGACLDCHKRTHAQAQLFHIGDTDAHDACLDATCWDDKVAAHANRTLDAALETGHELIDPKDATQLWGSGGALADGWIDVEHHLTWALRRQRHATEAERERALFEVFPERAAYDNALAQWNQRAGAYLAEHQADSLPDDFPPEPEEPEKTWSDLLGREHPSIKVTLDRDGHARRLVTQADLAAALWDLGMKNAYKVLRPRRESQLPGSPGATRAESERAAFTRERERRDQRAAEAAAVREAAMTVVTGLSVDELILAVTLMVCRYGVHYHEADALRRSLELKDGKRDRDLYLDAPNAALWAHAKDGLTDKTNAKDRLILALRILAERPVHEPSHDSVLAAVLSLDVKAARKVGRDRRKQQTARLDPTAA